MNSLIGNPSCPLIEGIWTSERARPIVSSRSIESRRAVRRSSIDDCGITNLRRAGMLAKAQRKVNLGVLGASAESSRFLGNGNMGVVGRAERGTNPFGQLVGGQQPRRFDHPTS